MKKLIILVGLVVLATALAPSGRAAAQPMPTYRQLSTYCGGPPIAGCEVIDRLCRRDATLGAADVAAFDPARCDLSQLGGGRTAAAAAGVAWVPVLTDVFLARAQAELGLFVQRRIGKRLCKGDVKTLLTGTCALVGGDDPPDSVVSLPAAVRADLTDLPRRLLALARGHVEESIPTLTPPARAAACHALAAWEAYPVLRDRGPVEALRQLGRHQPIPACGDPVALTVAWSGVLASVLDDVLGATGDGTIDAAALRAALELTVRRVVPPERLPADLGARLDVATPRLVELVHLLIDLARHGPLDRSRVARALELATELVIALGDGDDSATVHVLGATAALAAGRYTAAVAHLAALPFLGERAHAAVAALMKVGGLAAALAEARTDDEARAALEAAAAPVGSYRAYREGWTVFLGGHAGLAAGLEQGIGDGDGVERAPTLAPILPVGLELGGPLGRRSSFNLLLSAIDLGAVAAVRLGSDDVDQGGADGAPRRGADTSLAGVVAPGLFAAIGVGDSPFVIGAGAQYLPASRAVFACEGATACDATRSAPVYRAMIYVGLDLPLVRLSP